MRYSNFEVGTPTYIWVSDVKNASWIPPDLQCLLHSETDALIYLFWCSDMHALWKLPLRDRLQGLLARWMNVSKRRCRGMPTWRPRAVTRLLIWKSDLLALFMGHVPHRCAERGSLHKHRYLPAATLARGDFLWKLIWTDDQVAVLLLLKYSIIVLFCQHCAWAGWHRGQRAYS